MKIKHEMKHIKTLLQIFSTQNMMLDAVCVMFPLSTFVMVDMFLLCCIYLYFFVKNRQATNKKLVIIKKYHLLLFVPQHVYTYTLQYQFNSLRGKRVLYCIVLFENNIDFNVFFVVPIPQSRCRSHTHSFFFNRRFF